MKLLLTLATLLVLLCLSQAQLAPNTLARTISAPQVPAPSIAPPPASGPAVPYRTLLQRLYATICELKESPAEWPGAEVAAEVATIRGALRNAPATATSDAALKLCVIGERLTALTAPFEQRYTQVTKRSGISSRSYEEQARAEKDAEAKDASFKANIVRQWKEQAAPFQTAARGLWATIPEAASVTGPAAASALAQRKGTWRVVMVDRILKDGAVVVPMIERAIASSSARIGGGGGVGTGYVPGKQRIFAKGVTGAAEDQRLSLYGYEDGTHTYMDEFGELRTVEKWTVLKQTRE